MSELHATEHRGYRELHAMARQIVTYWGQLAERAGDADPEARKALEKGVEQARALIEELTPRTASFGVHGGARAHGAGKMIATSRAKLRDNFLEYNQALRLAALDAEHVATLCGYLAACAQRRGDAEMGGFFETWEKRSRRLLAPVRKAAIAGAADPDRAIEPAVGGPLGKAGHAITYAIGTVGEWTDRKAAG